MAIVFSPILSFSRRLIWIVARIRVEHRGIEPLVVAHGIHEALARHIAVVIAGKPVRRHDALYQPVVIVNFLLQIALFVDGIAPAKSLLYGEVTVSVEVQRNTFIL